MKRGSILATGFSTYGTGYNRVLISLFEFWSKEYTIHFVGIGLPPDELNIPVIYHTSPPGGGDALGIMKCEELIKEVNPDIVFLLNDLSRIAPLIRRLAIYRPQIRLLAYFPVEGELKLPDFIEPLQYLDRIITYTNFGKQELNKAEEALQKNNPYFILPEITVIAHGVDTRVFKPLAKGAKKKVPSYLIDQLDAVDNNFIALNANQFQYRKQIRTTLEGFCLFSRNKGNDVRLVLHHTLLGVYGREEVEKLVKQVDDCYNCSGSLVKRVIISPPAGVNALEEKDLVDLYRLSDVGINTSAGEGWGLVSFEHAATGAAQIVPRHTSCAELWKGKALFLDRQDELETPADFSMKLFKLSAEQLAENLNKLYEDKGLLAEISEQCFKNATRKKYSWAEIATTWMKLFDEVKKESGMSSPLPLHFNFRKDTIDAAVYRMAVVLNEYRLPDNFLKGDVVIDIGAHIGCFSYLAVTRGAKVYAWEANDKNYTLAKKHLDLYLKQNKLILTEGAVYSTGSVNTELYLSSYPENGWNTGGATVIGQKSGKKVKTTDFDKMLFETIEREGKKIRLLKLDCEGSEWPILINSQLLDNVEEICGEYHEFGGEYDNGFVPEDITGYSKLTSTELYQILKSKGFEAEIVPKVFSGKPDGTGLFFAKRK